MLDSLLLPDLRQMLQENDLSGLREFCTVLHPAVAAEVLEKLSNEDAWKVLANSNLEQQVEIFEFISLPKQVELVDSVDRASLSKLIEAMSADDRVDLLARMDPDHVESLLPLIAQAERSDIRKLLSYPEDSAGSIMTTEYASLPGEITVAEALDRLRLQAPNRETIYYVYLVDEQRRLKGMISLTDLILARPDWKLSRIKTKETISVNVSDDKEQVAQTLAKYDFIAIPVVDGEGHLVGIVTHDDVLDVVIEEATEDAMRMAGVAVIQDNYLDIPFASIWAKRSVWLSCLFIAELFTFTAMAYFHKAIDEITVLALLVPLCISTGGNSGSQAATLITRAMALGQVTPRDWWRVLRHELLLGVALGATLGTVAFLRAAMTPASIRGDADRWMLALTLSQSVTTICLWGTLVGSMLPLIFKKLGFDPGYASSPFVATFVDVTGIVIFFSIAEIYLL